MQVLLHQRVGERQHDRDVGAGPDRVPFGGQEIRGVVPDRAERHELDAGLLRAPVPVGPWCARRCRPKSSWAFLSGMPPNGAMSWRFSSRLRQSVSGPMTGWTEPTTRGAMTRPAEKL